MAGFTYTLPTVNGSEDTWGATLNANWTAIGTFLGSLDSAELAKLDGLTASTAELNILDGVTATAAELNILDGVTATTAELNILDGVTATAAELNYIDGVTSNIQTQMNLRANLASPSLTGNPTAPTQTASNNTTRLATTAFVRDAVPDVLSAGGTAPIFAARAFGKVSSNAKVSGGNFSSWNSSTNTVSFSTNMENANYAVSLNSKDGNGNCFVNGITSSGFVVNIRSSSGGTGDPANFEFIVVA